MYLVAACSRLNHSTYLVLLGLLLCVLSPYLYCLNERHSKKRKKGRGKGVKYIITYAVVVLAKIHTGEIVVV